MSKAAWAGWLAATFAFSALPAAAPLDPVLAFSASPATASFDPLLAFSAPHPMPGFGGEPNVLVGPDDAVYVGSLGGFWLNPGSGPAFVYQGFTRIWKRDVGASAFVELAPPNAGFGGRDEALAVGPDGTLYATGQWSPTAFVNGVGILDPGTFCASVARSTNGGASWLVNPLACSVPLGDRPWIAADEFGHTWVVHQAVCCVGVHDVLWSVDGLVFAPQGVANTAGGFPGNLFVDRLRHRVYEATHCQTSRVCLSSTATDLPTPQWSVATPIQMTALLPGLNHVTGAVDDAGNLYAAWIDKRAGAASFGAYVARSTDGGTAWSTPVRVSGPGTGVFPWIVAGSDGRTAVAWYEAPAMGGNPNNVPAGSPWNAFVATKTDWATDPAAAWTTVQVSASPNHFGPLCTLGAACISNRNLLDFFEATIGPDGKVHVAWSDDVVFRVFHAEQTGGVRMR